MSEKDSNKAQNSGSEKTNQSPLNPNGNCNGFIQYIIEPKKFDDLISSINNYSTKVDNYAAKIDVAIEEMKKTNEIMKKSNEEMKKSNENQEKALSLLTQLVSKYIPPAEKDKNGV